MTELWEISWHDVSKTSHFWLTDMIRFLWEKAVSVTDELCWRVGHAKVEESSHGKLQQHWRPCAGQMCSSKWGGLEAGVRARAWSWLSILKSGRPLLSSSFWGHLGGSLYHCSRVSGDKGFLTRSVLWCEPIWFNCNFHFWVGNGISKVTEEYCMIAMWSLLLILFMYIDMYGTEN